MSVDYTKKPPEDFEVWLQDLLAVPTASAAERSKLYKSITDKVKVMIDDDLVYRKQLSAQNWETAEKKHKA